MSWRVNSNCNMTTGASVFGEDITDFMDRWIGSVAVVTGASVGIGAAICEKLIKLGINVVGMARRVKAIEEMAENLSGEKGKLYPIFCDVTDEKNIIEAFGWIEENLGGISILINNAGTMAPTTLADGDVAEWRRVLEVNILGLSICTKEAIASMKKHGIDGHIIHINSIVGHSIPNVPCLNMYPPSKFAVTALTEILRRELGALEQPKIKISSVSPGLVDTEFLNYFTSDYGVQDALRKAPTLSKYEVADTILFVLSTPQHVQVHDIIVKVFGEAF